MISLPDAIERIRKVYDLQHRAAEPREVVAKHMGYGGLNGAALKTLSALLKYGLLEDANDGLRVSNRAINILFPETPEDRATAIRDAAFDPPLFAEINQRWESKVPSPESLKAYLIRRNFAQGAVDNVSDAYKATIDLVARESDGYDPNPDDDSFGNGDQGVDIPRERAQISPQKPVQVSPPPVSGFDISFVGTAIRMGGVISSKAEAKKVIDALTALQNLLPDDEEDPRDPDLMHENYMMRDVE